MALITVLQVFGPAGPIGATGTLITDASAVLAVPTVSKPDYQSPFIDSTFNTTLTRIANDTGTSTSPVSGTWGADARHVYSKQQPWNSDQTMITIENRSGGSPSKLILDGTTYAPLRAPCSGYSQYDYRWHPSTNHANEQINVNSAGTELMWYDVVNCVKTRTWTLPITANYGIGSGEGNSSSDGRFVVIGNNTQMVVVDMDPQSPYAAYPNKRIGPVYDIPACDFGAGVACTSSNVSVSPGGNYVDLKYSGPDFDNQDAHRIFDIDPVTLAITPHTMAVGSLRCGSFTGRNDGWIFPLKHADMAFDPYDNNAEVIIGGRSCSGSSIGRVVKVRLSDGLVTALSDPNNESSVSHVSTRSYNRPGWVYVTFYPVSGKRFNDEIVAVRFDGGAVERLTHSHTSASGCYRCESQAVPSPDGLRVIFASNWAANCGTGCGASSDIKDYVIDTQPLRGGACTEVWSWCSSWSACSNSQQTRTCTDANNCGTTTTRPALTQGCDSAPPIVSISSPTGGAIVSGTVTVNATASDDVSVSGVQFKLDGQNLGTEDISAPFSTSWDTITATVGSHVLSAVARDAAGNQGTTANVTVTISCAENWSCGSWSACSNSQQTRSCTDASNCGTTTTQPALFQSCTTPDTTPPTAITDLRAG